MRELKDIEPYTRFARPSPNGPQSVIQEYREFPVSGRWIATRMERFIGDHGA